MFCYREIRQHVDARVAKKERDTYLVQILDDLRDAPEDHQEAVQSENERPLQWRPDMPTNGDLRSFWVNGLVFALEQGEDHGGCGWN